MIGILANRAMQLTDWSTRICLVPVSDVRDRSTGPLTNTWVPTSEQVFSLSNLPLPNAMQYSEDPMVNRTVRLNLPPILDLIKTQPDDISSQQPPTTTNGRPSSMSPNSVAQGTPGFYPRPTSVSPPRTTPGAPRSPPALLAGNGYDWAFVPVPGRGDQFMLVAASEPKSRSPTGSDTTMTGA